MNIFDQLDFLRRLQGQLLGMAGLAHIETPSRVVFSKPPVTLKAYKPPIPAAPALLIVPAPIKRAYILDLFPSVSVVQRCLRNPLRVYLLQWEEPGAREQKTGLAEYADRYILACLDAIANEIGRGRTFLAGHSLGGTFAAIFAALHPELVRGLLLLGAPLQFGCDSGAFSPLVALAPPAHAITAFRQKVAGSFLTGVSVLASPSTFLWERRVDFLRSLPDLHALLTHLRVVRWTMDEMALPRRLFEEVVDLLYRENRFMEDRLFIQGQLAAPAKVDAPILSVVESGSNVVPPSSVLPFHAAAGNTDTRVLWYEGDTGVALQHVGMLVGKRAHQELWPRILHWLQTHSQAR